MAFKPYTNRYSELFFNRLTASIYPSCKKVSHLWYIPISHILGFLLNIALIVFPYGSLREVKKSLAITLDKLNSCLSACFGVSSPFATFCSISNLLFFISLLSLSLSVDVSSEAMTHQRSAPLKFMLPQGNFVTLVKTDFSGAERYTPFAQRSHNFNSNSNLLTLRSYFLGILFGRIF